MCCRRCVFSVCGRERAQEKARVRKFKCVEYEFGEIADLYVNILQYVYIYTCIWDTHTQISTQELWTRLPQLHYLLENSSVGEKASNIVRLKALHVDQLWEALNGSTECCLRWLRLAADSGGIFDDTTQVHLFRKYICRMNPAAIGPHGFDCFQALFADVNNASLAWEISGRSGQKSGCKVNGLAFVGRRVRALWKDEKMHNGTICNYKPPTDREVQKHTVRWDDTGKEDTHDWTDLHCFHDWHLFEDELSVNILAYEILSITKPDALEGLDFLWGACFLAKDDIVSAKAQAMMLDITSHMPNEFQQEVLERLNEMHKMLKATDGEVVSCVLRVRKFTWKFIVLRVVMQWPSRVV